ncbi:MAG: hypothetical protein KME17_11295 [Cyanosarcina radialis HA8281-LM2]|nr:hypothetical protein [Cyanosarcina radialis HA8281-LM2]
MRETKLKSIASCKIPLATLHSRSLSCQPSRLNWQNPVLGENLNEIPLMINRFERHRTIHRPWQTPLLGRYQGTPCEIATLC